MDYFQILNLQKEPFSNSPEPDFFFQSDQHLACLQKLELAIRLRRGLNIVMGEVGTGKTTLCRQLILNFSRTAEDRQEMETHLILDPSFTNAQEFLTAVSRFLGLASSPDEKSEWQLKEDIKKYLFRRGIDEGKIVVLIVDEGQKLPDFCLEILREFLNYETNEYKLLQMVIFAQREFEQVLQARQNFADRANQFYFLKPLNFRNSIKMIRFRIARASADPAAVPTLFSLPGLWAIYRSTGGYPRKIIALCHQVILAMIIQNRRRAGFFLVRSCAGRVSTAEAARWPRWALAFSGAGLLFFLVAVNHGQFNFFSPGREKDQPKNALPALNPVTLPLPPAVPAEEAIAEVKSSAPPAPLPAEQPAPATVGEKRPALLGTLAVKRNDRVLRMLEPVYGKDALNRLEAVAKANPQIRNLDLVKNGDVIKVPVCSGRSNPLPPGTFWVQIAAPDNLQEAYDLMTEAAGGGTLLLLPCWSEQRGLSFPVMLQEGFASRAAAASAIKALPPALAARARVVAEWAEGTVFF